MNKVRSALSNCISQVINWGAYFFTILVSRPDEVSIATVTPASTSARTTMEPKVIPIIFSAFFISIHFCELVYYTIVIFMYTIPLAELVQEVMEGRLSDAKTQVCILKAARILGV